MIITSQTLLHWNYLVALDNDLDEVSRYIEFAEDNFSTYSIELAHLLLAASSEVDVVAKGLCQLLDQNSQPTNINDYKRIITTHITDFCDLQVSCPKYGLTLEPWINWKANTNPDWGKSYNNVKHQRNDHFRDANLKNALNAMAALLVVVFYFYKNKLGITNNPDLMEALRPETKLMFLPSNYYPSLLRAE